MRREGQRVICSRLLSQGVELYDRGRKHCVSGVMQSLNDIAVVLVRNVIPTDLKSGRRVCIATSFGIIGGSFRYSRCICLSV